ncbi:MAG TPA: alpha/beta hydrolase [Caulobacteraceae bacterium]|jgi:pimeloyl-ACP methyl ester carboxylesterase|nr:alpha/beta hydrolase [Caulobacteraceae bacterium]
MRRRDLILSALAVAPVLSVAPKVLASQPSSSDRFTVVVEGQGPDVVLIPGLTSSRTVFDGIVEHLKPHFRLHRLQLAGFAGAPAGGNASGDVVAPVVEDLCRYIEASGLKTPAVIGHSLGGEAGLMLAARHPQCVGRLMVVDALPFISVLFFGPTATPDSVRPQADAIRDQMIASSDADFAKSETGFIASLVKTDAARPELTRQAVASDRSVVARAMHDLMVTDLTPELPKIAAPTTVLYAYDQKAYGIPAAMVDGWYQAAYGGLKGVKLVRIDDSFHFVMIDQPQQFSAAVDTFLA